MSRLNALEELTLSKVRVAMDPSEADKVRARAKLLAAFECNAVPSLTRDEIPLPDGSNWASSAAASHLGAAGLLAWLKSVGGGALLGGALLGGALGFYGGYLVFEKPAVLVSESTATAPPVSTEVAIPSVPKDVHEEPLGPSPEGEESTRAEAIVSLPLRSKPRVSQTSKRSDEPEEERKTIFHEEISYLRRAQSALKRGNASLAHGLMQSLDELHPHGALMPERRVTRVLALCALGRVEEAQREAEVLLSSQPKSVYANRLKGSCAFVQSEK